MKEQSNWPKEIKRTRPRALIMQALEGAQQPLGAMEIFSQIEKTGESVWLSTVYRSLELLVEKGVVDKIAVANSDMAVYAINRSAHRHYAVCMGCRRIVPVDDCPLGHFTPKVAEEGFQVVGHNLEIYGYCDACTHQDQEKKDQR